MEEPRDRDLVQRPAGEGGGLAQADQVHVAGSGRGGEREGWEEGGKHHGESQIGRDASRRGRADDVQAQSVHGKVAPGDLPADVVHAQVGPGDPGAAYVYRRGHAGGGCVPGDDPVERLVLDQPVGGLAVHPRHLPQLFRRHRGPGGRPAGVPPPDDHQDVSQGLVHHRRHLHHALRPPVHHLQQRRGGQAQNPARAEAVEADEAVAHPARRAHLPAPRDAVPNRLLEAGAGEVRDPGAHHIALDGVRVWDRRGLGSLGLQLDVLHRLQQVHGGRDADGGDEPARSRVGLGDLLCRVLLVVHDHDHDRVRRYRAEHAHRTHLLLDHDARRRVRLRLHHRSRRERHRAGEREEEQVLRADGRAELVPGRRQTDPGAAHPVARVLQVQDGEHERHRAHCALKADVPGAARGDHAVYEHVDHQG
mmetsp:Transcript_4508/g.19206  ORF Transcript_4508/g.19206 Transcript_4508/m.19206 type:complete len:421 (-) Transcript_4508:1755-3017(-)